MSEEESREIAYLIQRKKILYDDLGLTAQRLRELGYVEQKERDFPVSAFISVSRRDFESCKNMDQVESLIIERLKVAAVNLRNVIETDFKKRQIG